MKKITLIIFIIILLISACSKKKEEVRTEGKVDIQMYKLQQVPFSDNLADLESMGNVDFNKFLEKNQNYNPKSLDTVAFKMGADIADALICIKARNMDKLTQILQNLPDYGELFGVSEEFLKLSTLIKPLLDQQKWDQIEMKLNLYQKKIINELYNIKSYDYVILVQYGGWIKGLESLSYILKENYNKDKTSILHNTTIIMALLHDVTGIRDEDILFKDYMKHSIKNLEKIKEIIFSSKDGHFSKKEVNKLYELSSDISALFAK